MSHITITFLRFSLAATGEEARVSGLMKGDVMLGVIASATLVTCSL